MNVRLICASENEALNDASPEFWVHFSDFWLLMSE